VSSPLVPARVSLRLVPLMVAIIVSPDMGLPCHAAFHALSRCNRQLTDPTYEAGVNAPSRQA
jgi:hypothetical protein